MSKNSGPLKTTHILIAFIPTGSKERSCSGITGIFQLYEYTSYDIYSWLPKPTIGCGWQEEKGTLVGKLEEEHWWWGTTRSVKGFLSLGLLWGNFVWTQVFANAATYQFKLGCRKIIKFHRKWLWLWKPGKGKGLSWWTRDTVSKGRTSAWVKIGLGWREEVNLEACLDQRRMSWIPPVSVVVGVGKSQIPQMVCPSQKQPEPSTSKVEEIGKMKRKMAMVSLGADHSGSSKRVCLSVCTETELNPPQLLSQAQGRHGTWAPGESLSVLADNTFPRQQEQRGVGTSSPCPAQTPRWQEPSRADGPATAASPVPASLPGLAALYHFNLALQTMSCQGRIHACGIRSWLRQEHTLHGSWVTGEALPSTVPVGQRRVPGSSAPPRCPVPAGLLGWLEQQWAPSGHRFGCSGWNPSNAHPRGAQGWHDGQGRATGSRSKAGKWLLLFTVIAALSQMS